MNKIQFDELKGKSEDGLLCIDNVVYREQGGFDPGCPALGAGRTIPEYWIRLERGFSATDPEDDKKYDFVLSWTDENKQNPKWSGLMGEDLWNFIGSDEKVKLDVVGRSCPSANTGYVNPDSPSIEVLAMYNHSNGKVYVNDSSYHAGLRVVRPQQVERYRQGV